MSRDDFETNHEFTDLAQALREHRPTPEPEFTERLDKAVTDHFPPEWVEETSVRNRSLGTLGERIRRRLEGTRAILPTLAGAVGVLFVVAVVATNLGGEQSGDDGTVQSVTETEQSAPAGGSSADMSTAEREAAVDAAAPTTSNAFQDSGMAAPASKRDVATEAEITLGTDPAEVQEVANQVVEVTDEHNGIVMNSQVTDGEAGSAGATFSLMIPSARMDSAVADLSEIADLRSRSQELTDITAPTNRAEDAIADSEAKIKGLLGELETTYDEDERARIERQIRFERQEKSWAETRLNRLERRADYTPVALRIETGGDTTSDEESSSWGLPDALDDAGKLLGAAAGVTVLALAVAIPIGIVVLISLAFNRAWVRRSRRRVLADDK